MYKVKFKHCCSYFTLSSECICDDIEIEIDNYVIAQGDRGNDMGRVCEMITSEKYHSLVENTKISGKSFVPVLFILRKANNLERQSFKEKYLNECTVLDDCQKLVCNTGVPIQVLDVEYQFDRRKLTLYFTGEKRIMLKGLLSALFSIYKVRIWLYRIEYSNEHLFIANREDFPGKKVLWNQKGHVQQTLDTIRKGNIKREFLMCDDREVNGKGEKVSSNTKMKCSWNLENPSIPDMKTSSVPSFDISWRFKNYLLLSSKYDDMFNNSSSSDEDSGYRVPPNSPNTLCNSSSDEDSGYRVPPNSPIALPSETEYTLC